jgi:hypothetical protein
MSVKRNRQKLRKQIHTIMLGPHGRHSQATIPDRLRPSSDVIHDYRTRAEMRKANFAAMFDVKSQRHQIMNPDLEGPGGSAARLAVIDKLRELAAEIDYDRCVTIERDVQSTVVMAFLRGPNPTEHCHFFIKACCRTGIVVRSNDYHTREAALDAYNHEHINWFDPDEYKNYKKGLDVKIEAKRREEARLKERLKKFDG